MSETTGKSRSRPLIAQWVKRFSQIQIAAPHADFAQADAGLFGASARAARCFGSKAIWCAERERARSLERVQYPGRNMLAERVFIEGLLPRQEYEATS